MTTPSFGLILPNRAVVLGAVTARDLIDLTTAAEGSGAFDTIWVGDSLLAKPRLESVTLLGMLAGVTTRARLGVGCMATFVHRHPVLLAHQWASLDVLSSGRSWLAVCLGGPTEAGAAQAREHAAMSIAAKERVGRLEEGVAVLRRLFSEDQVTHEGTFYRFEDVTIEPHPVQQPCPIWIASNPTGLTWRGGASAPDAVVERSFRRVARLADGWMTNKLSPDEFRQQWGRILAMAREEGRDPARLGSALYHNINITENRQAGLEESKAFLDRYYTAKFNPAFVEGWTISGPPERCIRELNSYFAAGVGHMALRLTSWDQRGQLTRFLNEVAPAVAETTPPSSREKVRDARHDGGHRGTLGGRCGPTSTPLSERRADSRSRRHRSTSGRYRTRDSRPAGRPNRGTARCSRRSRGAILTSRGSRRVGRFPAG